jgi:subtilisin
MRKLCGVCSAVLLSIVVATTTAIAAPGARGEDDGKDTYIVVLRGDVTSNQETEELENRLGFESELRYRRALKGFSAQLNANQLEKLRQDPDVAFVDRDRQVHALDLVASGETVPSGVRRMGAAAGTSVRAAGANVAVIDTGIDLAHSDLNAIDGVDCVTPGTSAQDDEGHGTHVAGSIGARNTGSGLVGVAPGTKVFAAKVLNASGSGTISQVICGIDWVTSTRSDANPDNDIAVANMSLGGVGSPVKSCSTTTDAEHKAICNATAKGVTFVVAAGNNGWDFDYAPAPDTPAAYPEVLTVSALSDSDGAGGALGPAPACRTSERDDRYASFSNYAATSAGQAHTIAAPGVCILSTRMGGGTTTMSGTSMATPHIAGAVALCIAEGATAGPCAGLSPAQIIAKMRSDADAYNRDAANSSFGFTGDPLRPVSGRYFGFLAWVDGSAGSAPPPDENPPSLGGPGPGTPPTPVSASPTGTTIETRSLRSGSATSLAADDNSYYQVNSTSSGTRITSWYGSFGGVSSALANLRVTYKGKNSRSCTQTLSIWSWASSSWVQIDSRSVSTSEVQIQVSPAGTLADYVSSTGELRVRVHCQRSSGSFYSSGDLMRINYEA